MPEPVAPKYRAFLSYSHRDTAWAKWLHRALEHFHIDKDLAGRETRAGVVPKTLRPIFRDREDFSAGHSLTEQTLAALEASRFLIVICSPNAAKSIYVNEEIRRFKALGGASRVIPLIVEGEPGDGADECFPPALRFRLGPEGEITTEQEEPIAADARPQGDGKEIAKLKVISGLLGVGFDEIVRRDERARRRRNRIWASLAGVFLVLAVIATGSSIYAYQKLILSEKRLDQAIEISYGFVTEATGMSDRFGVPVDVSIALLKRAEAALNGLIAQGADTRNLNHRKALMLLSFAKDYEKLGEIDDWKRAVNEAEAILLALAARDAGNDELQRDLAAAHLAVGDWRRTQGLLAKAQDSFRASLAVRERLVAANPDNAIWKRDLAQSYDRLGYILWLQGHLSKALANYRRTLAISQELAAADPGNLRAQRDLAFPMLRIVIVQLNQAESDEALEGARAILPVYERLIASNPKNTGWQFELASIHSQIGNALRALDRFDEALVSYRASHAIRERLAQADGKNARLQFQLSVSLKQFGEISAKQGALPEALKYYRAAFAIQERLSADQKNAARQANLSDLHRAIGEALVARGKSRALSSSSRPDGAEPEGPPAALAAAMEHFHASLAILARIVPADPENSDLQVGFADSHSWAGTVLAEQGATAEALAEYRTALAITERFALVDATDVRWQIELVRAHWGLAKLDDDAPGRLALVIATLRALQERNKLNAEQSAWLPQAEAQLAKLKAAQAAPR